MSMLRNLLMQKQGQQSNDLAEVYAYADSIGVTPQQVDAALADKPAIIREKLIAWKYLLHSLVDTGYTPWLQGDGVAYIETDITPKLDSYARFRIIPHSTSGTQTILGAKGDSSKNYYAIGVVASRLRGYWYDNSSRPITTLTKNNDYTVTAGEVRQDGVTILTAVVEKTECSYPFYIFACNERGKLQNGTITNKSINYIEVSGLRNSVEVTSHFVPYSNNGVYGMLDLVTGTFYGSAVPNGLFTYILEDANGNAVNIT